MATLFLAVALRDLPGLPDQPDLPEYPLLGLPELEPQEIQGLPVPRDQPDYLLQALLGREELALPGLPVLRDQLGLELLAARAQLAIPEPGYKDLPDQRAILATLLQAPLGLPGHLGIPAWVLRVLLGPPGPACRARQGQLATRVYQLPGLREILGPEYRVLLGLREMLGQMAQLAQLAIRVCLLRAPPVLAYRALPAQLVIP